MDIIRIEELSIPTHIGVYPWEHAVQQTVKLDLELAIDAKKIAVHDTLDNAVDYAAIATRLTAFLSTQRFQLLETLAERCTELLLQEFQIGWLRLSASKPGAIAHAKNVRVIIERPSL